MIVQVYGRSHVAIEVDETILVIEGIAHTEIATDTSQELMTFRAVDHDTSARKISSPNLRTKEIQPDSYLSEPEEPVT